MNKELVEKIMEAAVRAPSGDNVQPWKFQVSKNYSRIDLYNLPTKDNSYYNYHQTASYIAHGAVLENILISARHLGINAQYKLFPNSSDHDLVARIDLAEGTAYSDPLYFAIFNRCTNRFPFRRIVIKEELVEKLNDSVKKINNTKISLVSQKDKINPIAKALMINDRLVFEDQEIHGFLFDKIRWTKKQVEETQDGMPIGVLGLSLVERFFFPAMRFWWFVKVSNFFGLSRIIALKCWWNMHNASILGMISLEGDDKFAFVQGGRAVQRLWLEATHNGLDLQPIIGLPLLINRFTKNELQAFSIKHRQMVERAATILRAQFGIAESDTMIMGFRLGKGRPGKVKTIRRKI